MATQRSLAIHHYLVKQLTDANGNPTSAAPLAEVHAWKCIEPWLLKCALHHDGVNPDPDKIGVASVTSSDGTLAGVTAIAFHTTSDDITAETLKTEMFKYLPDPGCLPSAGAVVSVGLLESDRPDSTPLNWFNGNISVTVTKVTSLGSNVHTFLDILETPPSNGAPLERQVLWAYMRFMVLTMSDEMYYSLMNSVEGAAIDNEYDAESLCIRAGFTQNETSELLGGHVSNQSTREL